MDQNHTNENPLSRPDGLSNIEVTERLSKYGQNKVREEKHSPILSFLKKFWGPVPWMFELTAILELVLDKDIEAVIIAGLLVVSSILSFIQENRAQNALYFVNIRGYSFLPALSR